MAYKDIREFIAALDAAGELRRIATRVSPELEITEICDRVVKSGGPALLFENVEGSDFPLLINAYGTRRRMNMAIGDVDDIARRVEEILTPDRPEGIIAKARAIPKLIKLSKFFPESVKTGPCKEVIQRDGFDLGEFPILKCWPQDGGRYLTLPLVFTRNPLTGKRNCGMYRMQVYDGRTTGMHWHTHKGGAEHYRLYAESGAKRMPVAVAVGADPAVTFCGALPLPDEMDEMVFAGFLRGAPVEMVRCETSEIEVPANAEIVLEGYVEIGERRTEGPFGDHTGFYSLQGDFPVFRLTCVTRRARPVYHATVVGRPPMEDCFMGEAIGRILLPAVRRNMPEIVDIHMPFEGVFHNMMIVSIRKRYPGHARKIMHGIWGMGQMAFTKVIVVVDEDVPVRDVSYSAWKALNSIDPKRDIEFVQGPVDELDHAAPAPRYGSKMGIDATRKLPEEGFARPWPDEIEMSAEVRGLVDEKWESYGI